MFCHADVPVIGDGLRCRQKDKRGVESSSFVRSPNQFLADPLTLKVLIHGEIRQVCAEAVVGDRP